MLSKSAPDRAVEERLLQTLARLHGAASLLLFAHRLHEWFPSDTMLMLNDGVLHNRLGSAIAAARGGIGG